MMTGVRSFLHNHVGSSSGDYERKGLSSGQKAAVVGGWVALTTGVGAAIGAARQAQDLVSISQVPVAETVRVQTGTSWQPTCSFPMQSGDVTIWMPSCYQDVPVYEDRPTGNTLYKDVQNHSVGFPNSILQGALLGLGVGVVTGVAGLVIAEALKK